MKKLLLIPALILILSKTIFAQCSSWIEASSVRSTGYGTDVATDANNNVYSTGSFYNTISFGSDTLVGANEIGYYVNKFNSSGVVQWAIQFQTLGGNPPIIYQNNGALYVAGTFYDTLITNVKTNSRLVLPGENFFLIKLDLNGNILWTKTYKGPTKEVLNLVNSIAVNNLNQIYFTGAFFDTATFGSNVLIEPIPNTPYYDTEAFITKTDSNGNVLWAIQSTTTTQIVGCIGSSITTDKDENVLLVGSCDSSITFGSKTFNPNDGPVAIVNPFIAKFDSSGNCLWVTGGTGQYISPDIGVVTDAQDNIYFVGIMDSTITFSGTTIYPDNGPFYYGKYTPSGNLIWIKETGTPGGLSSLIISASNNLWMSGWVNYSQTKFGNFTLSNPCVFITEFDTSGTFLNAVGSKGIDYPASLALDGEGDLYIGCTNSSDTLSFDGTTVIGPSIDNTESIDVILKYCTSEADIPQPSAINNQLSIYPNPTAGLITITSAKNIDAITVTNLLGQIELKSPLGDLGVTRQEIDLSNFPAGMYFVTVASAGETTTGKIIVSR